MLIFRKFTFTEIGVHHQVISVTKIQAVAAMKNSCDCCSKKRVYIAATCRESKYPIYRAHLNALKTLK